MTGTTDSITSFDASGPVLWDAAGKPLSKEGKLLAPAALNVATVVRNLGKTYSFRWDEAMRDNPENALAMGRDAFYRSLMQERIAATVNLEYEVACENEDDPLQVLERDAMNRNWRATFDLPGPQNVAPVRRNVEGPRGGPVRVGQPARDRDAGGGVPRAGQRRLGAVPVGPDARRACLVPAGPAGPGGRPRRGRLRDRPRGLRAAAVQTGTPAAVLHPQARPRGVGLLRGGNVGRRPRRRAAVVGVLVRVDADRDAGVDDQLHAVHGHDGLGRFLLRVRERRGREAGEGERRKVERQGRPRVPVVARDGAVQGGRTGVDERGRGRGAVRPDPELPGTAHRAAVRRAVDVRGRGGGRRVGRRRPGGPG